MDQKLQRSVVLASMGVGEKGGEWLFQLEKKLFIQELNV